MSAVGRHEPIALGSQVASLDRLLKEDIALLRGHLQSPAYLPRVHLEQLIPRRQVAESPLGGRLVRSGLVGDLVRKEVQIVRRRPMWRRVPTRMPRCRVWVNSRLM